MSNIALRAEGLSKQFRLGERRERYQTARDKIVSMLTSPAGWGRRKRDDSGEEQILWALRNVSFEVTQGEVVGIIGRNGAGKSTLLKILSRITDPSEGYVDVVGRVSSLLEVGTGFHLELTGRENIYLNGAILGMKRQEINRKFDEIVSFAEVERFIDTPVKHYSSGMHLRLAFAVAAHLEPEILVIDEVLAVGDLAFQKKCLGKMEDVAASGRTVLYVSHMLSSVKQLCKTSIVLDGGQITYRGPVLQGLAHYTSSLGLRGGVEEVVASGWRELVVGSPGEAIDGGQGFSADAVFDLDRPFEKVRLVCAIDDSSGDCIAHNFLDFKGPDSKGIRPGRYRVQAAFPPLWLVPDAYTLYFKLAGVAEDGQTERRVSDRAIIDITDTSGQLDGKVRATLIPPVSWSITPLTAVPEPEAVPAGIV